MSSLQARPHRLGQWPASQRLLLLIVLLYVVLGTLYAVYTPAWQAPDEPAHYNYVRHLVESGRFPALQAGDYPAALLDELKTAKFPPEASIDAIRYEAHQPPLYYALAAPIYRLGGGALLPLRLLSVGFGAGVVLLTYLIAGRIFPRRPALALAPAALVAFLPQHLASAAQVGNDLLAELLFALVLLLLVRWATADRSGPAPAHRELVWLGLLLGLLLITKTTVYIGVPLVLGVLVWRWRRDDVPLKQAAVELLLIAVPAAILALPWWFRNVWVYGWPDVFGLIRHDAVVVGQPRTIDWITQYGWDGYLWRLVTFTFQSFWGVFGWMGVFMDNRVYLVLALLCAVVAAGLLMHEIRAHRAQALSPGQRYALRLLAVSALLTLLGYGWYNLQFVQHQGRYLFTALIPISLAFALGWDEALHVRSSRLLALGLVLVAAGLIAWGLTVQGQVPKWPAAIALAGAAGLQSRRSLPRQLDAFFFALPYAAMPVLSLYALFGAVVPQLAR